MPVPAEKFGRYTLLHRLAIGGMGEIWLARQSGPAGFDRFIAIKRLLPNLAESQEFVQMFQDEARLAARLTHAGICQVYEFDRIGNSYYLAMEYLHGETLASMLDRSIKEERPLSQAVIAYIVAQALEGLHFAHEAKDAEGHSLGLIHRDISPSNIFITYDGQVKLLDFGIAKATRRSVHTQAGSVKGKFGYIAPEVYRGQPIDRRVDLFSMGVVLWEMLTRRRLYNRGADYEILKAIVEEPPPDPREIDTAVAPSLAETTLKALDKFPSDRFQTALEMRRALSVYLRSLHEEMDAQRMAAVISGLYGQIWIDLRSSVLESFKDGSDDVANADALNPTLTDAQISELTQIAVTGAGVSAQPLFANRTPSSRTSAWGTIPAPVREVQLRRPSSPALTPSPLPAFTPALTPAFASAPAPLPMKPRPRARLWVGSAVALTALVSMVALATRQRHVEQPAEPVGSGVRGVETPTTAAEPSPPAPGLAPPESPTRGTPAPGALELGALAVTAQAVPQPGADAIVKPAARKQLARPPSHLAGKPSRSSASKILNPDQPMEWPKQ